MTKSNKTLNYKSINSDRFRIMIQFTQLQMVKDFMERRLQSRVGKVLYEQALKQHILKRTASSQLSRDLTKVGKK